MTKTLWLDIDLPPCRNNDCYDFLKEPGKDCEDTLDHIQCFTWEDDWCLTLQNFCAALFNDCSVQCQVKVYEWIERYNEFMYPKNTNNTGVYIRELKVKDMVLYFKTQFGFEQYADEFESKFGSCTFKLDFIRLVDACQFVKYFLRILNKEQNDNNMTRKNFVECMEYYYGFFFIHQERVFTFENSARNAPVPRIDPESETDRLLDDLREMKSGKKPSPEKTTAVVCYDHNQQENLLQTENQTIPDSLGMDVAKSLSMLSNTHYNMDNNNHPPIFIVNSQIVTSTGTVDSVESGSKRKNSSRNKKKKLKRTWTQTDKKIFAASQNFECGFCNSKLDGTFEVDHLEEFHIDGNDHFMNGIATCSKCHRDKTEFDRKCSNLHKWKGFEGSIGKYKYKVPDFFLEKNC